MADRPQIEFGRRRPNRSPDLPPPPAPMRSKYVALLVMGTFAVGGGAYAMMERENCQPVPPPAPGMAAPPSQGGCASRSWSSSGYHSSNFHFFGGNSSGGSAGGSEAASGSVSRGGFGGFARAFGFASG